MAKKELSKEALLQVREAFKANPDAGIEALKEVLAAENGERAPSIPHDPNVEDLKYIRYLRRVLRSRKPDPLVLVVIRQIFSKWGYKALSKVVATVGRKMGYKLRTPEIEEILRSYGLVVEPILAILLVDIIKAYHDRTIKEDTRTDFDD